MSVINDIRIIGHNLCSLLSILNELMFQKELKKNMTNSVFWTKIYKKKTTTTKQKKANIKNYCQSRESNPGPIAPLSDALPLDHRDN